MGLIPLVVLLVLVETAAWIVDANTQFRTRLLDRLALMEADNQPIGGDVELNWPPRALLMRYPDERRSAVEPYVIGGRTLRDAMPEPRTAFFYPRGTVKEGDRRVFVVGGSAAFGFPYALRDTFAARLDQRLRARGIRVLNVGQVCWSTGRLVPVVRRIVEYHKPDTLVIFAGNNEWAQWTPEMPGGSSAGRVRLMRFLAHSRALAAAEYWMLGRAPAPGETSDDEEDGFTIHYEISGATHAMQHPLDSPAFDARRWLEDKARFLRTFEDNLGRMIRLARDRDVRVVLLTVPFNYKLSPTWMHPQPWWFDPRHRQALVAAHRKAWQLLEDGRYEQALECCQEALALDPLPPVLNYLKGQCLEARGKFAAAEEAYAQCREHMIGHLGARLSINRSIAAVAESNEVTLIDVRRLFDLHSHEHGRWFNEDLVQDDCHPTPEGHGVIADALEEVLVDDG